jgi:hypothetical protein
MYFSAPTALVGHPLPAEQEYNRPAVNKKRIVLAMGCFIIEKLSN